MDTLPPAPAIGSIVSVRKRRYLVEEVTPPKPPSSCTWVRLSCVEDDAQGDELRVLWEKEIDAAIPQDSARPDGPFALDPPARFAAYLNTLRYGCVTSTDATLFQAPWRAGIDLVHYQLEPLRKALQLPRVNLLIADDVGLGKTIEAGLILRELVLRQRVRRTVVAVPPSVVFQWKDELEQRFGLHFIVYDRDFVSRTRRERGYGTNPWTVHSRFIISHALLRAEEYRAPLRDLLGDFDPASMLILDEAHHVAPASSSHYAIDSQLTRAVRDIADRFEHRLFLTATPHNGLSNSFSALLNLLDPQRFVRGTPVLPKLRDHVMVRRLKADLREMTGDFPVRHVVPIRLDNLAAETPELFLAQELDDYWNHRTPELDTLSKRDRATQALVFVNLQKRLCSSVEAFVRTLTAHRKALAAQSDADEPPPALDPQTFLRFAPGPDDDHAELDEALADEMEEQAMVQATSAARQVSGLDRVDRMLRAAQAHRHAPDARVRFLLEWIQQHLCPDLPYPEPPPNPSAAARWNPKRVLIFTEYADTKRYLEHQLRAFVDQTDQGPRRLATFHGGMSDESREAIKAAFNEDPDKHPLRILIATDAAREGVNLQNGCADLFHFDLPWNPSRMEQRNGRIDRKLQRSPDVRCHYFLYTQRGPRADHLILLERARLREPDQPRGESQFGRVADRPG